MHGGPVCAIVALGKRQEQSRTVARYNVSTERSSFPLPVTDILLYMTTKMVDFAVVGAGE